MNKLPEHVEKLTKEFTVENLLTDKACKPAIDFVRTIIKASGNVAQALKAHNGEWVQWAIKNGYDVRELWHDMNGEYSYTWDDHARMFVTASDYSILIVGHDSNLKAGIRSTLTAGNYCNLMAGYESVLRAEKDSILVGGYNSTFIAGDGSWLICWSEKGGVWKRCAAYVGDDGLKPHTPYQCIDWEWVEGPIHEYLCL